MRKQVVVSPLISEKTEAWEEKQLTSALLAKKVADPGLKSEPDTGPPEQLRLQTLLLGAPGSAAPHPALGGLASWQMTDLVGRLSRNSQATE